MNSCDHNTLELLPEKKKRLRCRHCHLTIEPEELGGNYCPECFEATGKKRYEFEGVEASEGKGARYLCLECNLIIESE